MYFKLSFKFFLFILIFVNLFFVFLCTLMLGLALSARKKNCSRKQRKMVGKLVREIAAIHTIDRKIARLTEG